MNNSKSQVDERTLTAGANTPLLPQDLYGNIIDNMRDGIYYVDRDRRILLWNKAAEDITGYSREEVLGRNCADNILKHIDKNGTLLCIMGCPLHHSMEDGLHREEGVFLRHKKGHRIPVAVRVIPIYEDGEIVGAAEIFSNASPRTYQDDLVTALTKLVMTDQLTGLSNRRHAETVLEARFREYKRFGMRFCAVFLDLDDFSVCNNTHGHDVGDSVLTGIANSFRHNFRDTDLLCRWGGEEFVGIFEANNEKEVATVAEKVRILVENSEVRLDDEHSIRITCSVGATLAKPDDTVDKIISRADSLMYKSKQKGKNCVTIG